MTIVFNPLLLYSFLIYGHMCLYRSMGNHLENTIFHVGVSVSVNIALHSQAVLHCLLILNMSLYVCDLYLLLLLLRHFSVRKQCSLFVLTVL